jgi:hypothetical protein
MYNNRVQKCFPVSTRFLRACKINASSLRKCLAHQLKL